MARRIWRLLVCRYRDYRTLRVELLVHGCVRGDALKPDMRRDTVLRQPHMRMCTCTCTCVHFDVPCMLLPSSLTSGGKQAKAAGAGSDKVPGTPKGNIKGKKPPAIATDAASADINHRSPLNLIRKWEKNGPASGDSAPAALAAKEVVQADAERDKSDQSQGKAGSSAEEESADAASASQPSTPCTPAGGYEAVLDSVRQEILQAEQIMSQVTCTFGVDRFSFLSVPLRSFSSLSLSIPPPLPPPAPPPSLPSLLARLLLSSSPCLLCPASELRVGADRYERG